MPLPTQTPSPQPVPGVSLETLLSDLPAPQRQMMARCAVLKVLLAHAELGLTDADTARQMLAAAGGSHDQAFAQLLQWRRAMDNITAGIAIELRLQAPERSGALMGGRA